MTDIKSRSSGVIAAKPSIRGGIRAAPVASRPEKADLISLVELMFFAYRDFTGEADAVLEHFAFGRAHHRVLHFVNRRPGLRVADLLDILRITKQSLARVLKELVDRGFISQTTGANDRRERRLYPTAEGKALALELARLQIAQIDKALVSAGDASEDIVRAFLLGMVGPQHRNAIAAAISSSSAIAIEGAGHQPECSAGRSDAGSAGAGLASGPKDEP